MRNRKKDENTHSELDLSREVFQVLANLLLQSLSTRFVGSEVDVAGCNDPGFALKSTKDLSSEFCASVSHGQGGRTSTVFSLDDLVASELDSVG